MPFADKGRRNLTTFALAAAVWLGWGTLAGAQFASGVNLVEVYAAVVDQAGNPVSGLTRADFTVLEDGAPQSLTAFAEGDFPLSVALGLDSDNRTSEGRSPVSSEGISMRRFPLKLDIRLVPPLFIT